MGQDSYWELRRRRQGFLVRDDMSAGVIFRRSPLLVMRLGRYEIASDRCRLIRRNDVF